MFANMLSMFINTFWRNAGGCHVCKHRCQRSAPPAAPVLAQGHYVVIALMSKRLIAAVLLVSWQVANVAGFMVMDRCCWFHGNGSMLLVSWQSAVSGVIYMTMSVAGFMVSDTECTLSIQSESIL